MAGGEQHGDTPDPARGQSPPAKQPLPPEKPRTRRPQPLPDDPDPSRLAKQPLPPEISQAGRPLPPGAPPMPSEPPRVKQPLPDAAPPPDGSEVDDAPGQEGREWWQGADVRDELRETWAEHGREGLQAAYEIGGQIGETVTARLPDPYAAAQQRGLDVRWLRLGVNFPAVALALLVSWGGQSPAGRMTHYAAREGIFAPLGWVLLPALVLGVVMVLPFGGALGAAVGALVSAAARGVVGVVRRAWSVPVAGYVLRLAVAVAVWSFTIAAGRLVGRTAINWLTGV